MRVAAAQIRSPWLDRDGATKRVVEFLQDAADDDVQLVAFPETFLPGYPFWLSLTDGARFNDRQQKAAYSAYLDAAVEVDGHELRTIREAAGDLGVFTYVGVAERSGGSVYATLLAIDPTHGVVGQHRKLMPTYEERLVWGAGDGAGLRVHQVGEFRVGGLNCWENWMPLARHALYAEGVELHVSVWPGSVWLTRDVTRFVAMEGRVFSLAAGAVICYDDVPVGFPFREELAALGAVSPFDGGSAIAGPDGRWIVAPVAGEEQLVVADLDAGLVRQERQNFDPTGHYSRPDVFSVTVDRRRRAAASYRDD